MRFPRAIVIHQVPFLTWKFKTCLIAKPPFTKAPFVNSRRWSSPSSTTGSSNSILLYYIVVYCIVRRRAWAPAWSGGARPRSRRGRLKAHRPNPPTNIVDFRGFDSSNIDFKGWNSQAHRDFLGIFPESLSQAMLVGRLGVHTQFRELNFGQDHVGGVDFVLSSSAEGRDGATAAAILC